LKFDTDTGELEEWTSLINPGFVIQEEITFLTSITPEQLVSAPYFEEVLGTLQRFVGDLPIIGHNVSFDVDFLVENGFDLGFRPIIDTFHLANFLYSDLKSLNLSNIVEDLGYIHADAHRAMSDVRATKFLFDAELEKMKNFTQEEYNIFASVSARTQNSPLDYIHGFIAPRYQVMELSTELGMKQFFSSPLERLKMSQMVPS
jgi:DNA polymerase III subunit epsilon